MPLKGELMPGVSLSDKTIHSLAYFVLTISWLGSLKKETNSIVACLIVSAVVFVYGILIEILQGTATLYREFDFFDIMANFIGIIIAFAFFITVFKKISIN